MTDWNKRNGGFLSPESVYEDQLGNLSKQINEKDKEIDRLNNIIKIMENYLELIVDLGFDYDGLKKPKDLCNLIDELVRYASLGRAYNTTEPIYVNDNKKYNILHEELKEGKE